MSYKRISPAPVVEGGTGAQTFTTHGVLLGQGTGAITATAEGATGQVLTGVTGGNPVWASPAASSISITGDSGGALTGAAFTVYANKAALNAGSTVGLSGSGTTLTLDVTDGTNSTIIGLSAGKSGATGLSNTGLGKSCLAGITTATLNTAVGSTAMTSLISGNNNTGVGYQALRSNQTGSENSAVGLNALSQITGGSYNTALGLQAGYNYTGSESSNINIGHNVAGTLGESNVLRIGNGTGTGTGQQNKAYISGIDGINVGSVSKVVTMASDQLGTATITAGTGISVTAGANTITIANTASSSISITGDSGGAQVGSSFTFTGGTSGAVFTGAAGTFTESFNFLNMADSSNTAGYVSYSGNKFLWAGPNGSGGQCIFIGRNAGNSTLSSSANIGIGFATLNGLTNGTGNVAIGSVAGNVISSGKYNTLVGYDAAASMTTGKNNVALGAYTLVNAGTSSGVTGGNYNVAIGTIDEVNGKGAGYTYTANESSNIVISNPGVAAESNVIRIGTTGSGSAQQNKCYIAGIDGVNVGSVTKVLTMASDQLGTATITAGTGISVTAGANSITIASTASSFTWSVITADQTAAVNNGYICNKAGTLALALPASSAVGDIIEVTGINTATGWQITQAAGQQIFFGTSSTTLGATGTLTSSNIRDSIRMVCVVANTTWNVISSIGDITIV